MPPSWNPAQYLHYAAERERPFWDLVARVPVRSPRRVVDLGCGPGTATVGLLGHWPDAMVLGVDSSSTMLEQARTIEPSPRLTFELGEITTWETEPASLDAIVSNAALQWVPGHLELFPRWLSALRPGGALAFQVPGNFGAPSHTLLTSLVTSAQWRGKLGEITRGVELQTPHEYYRRLRALGATVDVWETTYFHVLSGADPVLDWVRGSALRPYLAALDAGEAGAFTDSYGEALRCAYPPGLAGETLYPFRRVFVVATLT